MSKTTTTVFIIIFAVEAGLIIIGNVFAIFVFWTQRLRVKRTCFLLINLAVADFLVGVAEAIVLAVEKIPNARREEKSARSPWVAFQVFASGSSVMFLALISLERVYAVLRPLRHRVTSARAYTYSIVIIWLTGLCSAGLWLLTIYHPKVSTVYATVTTQSLLFVFLLVICGSYLTIRSRLHCTAPGLEEHTQNASERNLRLSKTFFIVVAVSLLLWFPAFVVRTVKEFCPRCFSPNVLSGVIILHLANSVVNPVVYSFRMSIFKEALKGCLRKRRQNLELRTVFNNIHNQVKVL